MDRSLDEIVSERHTRAPRGRHGGGGRRNDRTEYPRDGVRKVQIPPSSILSLAPEVSYHVLAADHDGFDTCNGIACLVQSTRDDFRTIDSDWVHDKYDEKTVARGPVRPTRRVSPERNNDLESSKLKVENVHYDLTEEDLDDLFNRIGPVEKLALTYDRAGRSNGIAFVTYERALHAKQAIREFDGANANGQPIRLTLISNYTSKSRNPFDTAVRPARSLAERITAPREGGRTRSESPIRHTDVSGPVPDGVDRYVPGQRGTRSRSPMPRRRDGRRPGARKERGERQGGGGGSSREGGRSGARPKKTQEELDAEMEDYWGNGGAKGDEGGASVETSASAATGLEADIEMAE